MTIETPAAPPQAIPAAATGGTNTANAIHPNIVRPANMKPKYISHLDILICFSIYDIEYCIFLHN